MSKAPQDEMIRQVRGRLTGIQDCKHKYLLLKLALSIYAGAIADHKEHLDALAIVSNWWDSPQMSPPPGETH